MVEGGKRFGSLVHVVKNPGSVVSKYKRGTLFVNHAPSFL